MYIETLCNKIESWQEDTMNFKITDVFSWRGSYDEPACSIQCVQATKEENLEMLNRLTSESFRGWKGGEFKYTPYHEIHFELDNGEWSNGQYLIRFLLKNAHEPIVQHIFQ
jgi:hypothetical protein